MPVENVERMEKKKRNQSSNLCLFELTNCLTIKPSLRRCYIEHFFFIAVAENFLHRFHSHKIVFDACSFDWLLRILMSHRENEDPTLQLIQHLSSTKVLGLSCNLVLNLIDFKNCFVCCSIFLGLTISWHLAALRSFGHANFSPFFNYNVTCSISMCSNRGKKKNERERELEIQLLITRKKRKIINEFTN